MKWKKAKNKSGALSAIPRGESKICGADIELGNCILGLNMAGGTGEEASKALLHEIEGIPGQASSASTCHDTNYNGEGGYGTQSYVTYYGNGGVYVVGAQSGCNPQDRDRKFLFTNGGCIYIDLSHLELCIPEVTSAFDHVACWHAMLHVARRAMLDANEKLPRGQQIQVFANNSDGLGHAYGSHLNFLVSRRTWKNIFDRKIHYMLYLAAYQVSSIIFTGQGKLGSENDSPEVRYQISQRADFFECLSGTQTTYNRPIVNSRDESLTHDRETARLHVIFYDNTLCHVACFLKVGVMQIILAMIEAEVINPNLILDDPVNAVISFSHDPALRTRTCMAGGKKWTALEIQLQFFEEAKRFTERGGCEGMVPHAEKILALWEDTLLKLKDRDFDALAGRLDWVLKRKILQRAMQVQRHLQWDSPGAKCLDQLYSSLDPSQGFYWIYEKAGSVERLVDAATIERFIHEPPADTRAWTRAMLLRKADAGTIDHVDWDRITFKFPRRGFWSERHTVYLDHPGIFTEADTGHLFRQDMSLEKILEALDHEGGGDRKPSTMH